MAVKFSEARQFMKEFAGNELDAATLNQVTKDMLDWCANRGIRDLEGFKNMVVELEADGAQIQAERERESA